MISSIPTEYAGVMFRSRLEVRWAMFFDTLGIRWDYEPESFPATETIRIGCDAVRHPTGYVPDFWINGSTWVEVKGSEEAFMRDASRYGSAFLQSLPDMEYRSVSPYPDWIPPVMPGIIILGEIPDFRDCGLIPVHTLIQKVDLNDIYPDRRKPEWVLARCEVRFMREHFANAIQYRSECDPYHTYGILENGCLTNSGGDYLFTGMQFAEPRSEGESISVPYYAYEIARSYKFRGA